VFCRAFWEFVDSSPWGEYGTVPPHIKGETR
jgi:hypothetical protein